MKNATETRRCVLAATAALVWAAGASAAPPVLSLSKQPLFLAQPVEPNLFVTLDDSYSMRSAFLPGSLDNSFYAWIDPTRGIDNSDDVRRCGWELPRFYSPTTNYVYYDPTVTYSPPLRSDGSSFPNANFQAAWIDGISANSGGLIPSSHVVDLGTQYFPTIELNLPISSAIPDADEAYFFVSKHHLVVRQTDSFAPDDESSSSCNDENAFWKLPFGSGAGAAAISAAFYFEYTGPRGPDGLPLDDNAPENRHEFRSWNYAARAITSSEDKQNFANWYSYYRTRMLAARTAMTFPFAERVSNIRIAWQNQEQNHFDPGTTVLRDYDATGKEEFFDWLFSHRMSGNTPTRAATIRAGNMLSASAGATDSTNPFWDPDSNKELSCRLNYHLIVTDGFWNEPSLSPGLVPNHDRRDYASLPTPEGWVGDYPSGGYKSGGGTGNSQSIFWNEQQSGEYPSLADIAFHYWISDARPDLPNNVPPRWIDLDTGVTTTLPPPANGVEAAQNAETFWNPKNDPARHQHLVNYAVSFGQSGRRVWSRDPAISDYTGLRTGDTQWPGVSNENRTGIDDLWHATVNSRGDFFIVDRPKDLADSLGQFLEIVNEQRGAAAAATVSSGVATESTMAFASGFDTTGWTGFVEAYRYAADGTLVLPRVWNAAESLSDPTLDPGTRNILTAMDADGSGIPFRWASLPSAYQSLLQLDPVTGLADGLGDKRLEFLRGDSTLEADKPGGSFRIRRNKLGAVAHASSVFVADPSGGYDDDQWPTGSPERAAADGGNGYAKFVQTHKNRRRQLIVGANDGMLHAFNAGFGVGNDPGDGSELWAYVPREVAANLPQLTRRGIFFEPFVDSSVAVRDVFAGPAKGWRTVLVGGLRRGGQGYFALDITDPSAIGEASAGSVVLWELSDDATGGEDLGFSYGVPNIARLHHGGWAAVLSGGYNSHAPDGREGSGDAALYIVDISDGTVLRKMTIPGATGLGPVTMGDFEGDGIDDFAVAGTLEGDLYYFDLTADSSSSWPAPTLLFEGERDSAGVPLRPITSAPRIFGDTATGKPLVLFGTGKMLEPDDPADLTQQAVYATRIDGGSYPMTQSDLAQRVLSRSGAGDRYFTISGSASATTHRGWYLQLGGDARDAGERIVSAFGAHFSSGAVLIGSIVPNGGDPCRGDLRGNFYILDASTGGALETGSIADSDEDGDIDGSDDAVGVALDQTAPGGTPAIIEQVGGGRARIPDLPGVELPTPTWRRRHHGEVR